jgi:hypothetical protein
MHTAKKIIIKEEEKKKIKTLPTAARAPTMVMTPRLQTRFSKTTPAGR